MVSKKSVPRTVFLLGIVSLINDMSSEMILPILPLFVASVGGGALAVGIIGSLGDTVSALLKAFSGYFSDKTKRRKPLVVSGYFLSALSKTLYAFAYSWPFILAARVGDRLGKGVRSAPRDALVAVSVGKEARGRAYGFHRAMDSLGAILGSLLVIVLFFFLKMDLRAILLVAGPLSFLTMLPLFLVKEKRAAGKKAAGKFFSAFSSLPKAFKKSMVPVSLFYLGNFTYMFFVLKAKVSLEGFALDPILLVLLLYVWFNVFYTLASYPMGALSDRVGRKKTIMFGYSLFAATCLGFAFFESLLVYVFLFALYGLFNATIEGNEKALAVDLAGENKGTAVGAFYATEGLMVLPSGVLAGYLWESFSPSAAFLFGAAMAVAAVFAMQFFVDSRE